MDISSKKIISFIRDLYQTKDSIPLHSPVFHGNEKKYVLDTIDTTFVSSIGEYVDKFELQIKNYTNSSRAIATVNGTSALHLGLNAAGVSKGDYVITQSLTFVATCNAINYTGAEPIFCDISKVSLGLCPKSVDIYLEENAVLQGDYCLHKETGRRIAAIVPMHTYGHPVELDEFVNLSKKWNIQLIEDAAESFGSFYKGKHTGTFGRFGCLSFNGNKIITTGGGGMVLCKEIFDGDLIKHISTTAKIPDQLFMSHDLVGYNYRMPNINAALGCAQIESIESYINAKRGIAMKYEEFFHNSNFEFVSEPEYARSNYWLNTILCPDYDSMKFLVECSNSEGVMTRPAWGLMHKSKMYLSAFRGNLSVTEDYGNRIVNLPSSVLDL